ncbi:MAG: hypothetical protein C0605_13625 [Hyphomicrobiales bacterium]|nr:MAG: hypothetical protein C0605_13625 [Hyphomicrobiales bacterium]
MMHDTFMNMDGGLDWIIMTLSALLLVAVLIFVIAFMVQMLLRSSNDTASEQSDEGRPTMNILNNNPEN